MERDIKKANESSEAAVKATIASTETVVFAGVTMFYPPALAGVVVCFLETLRQVAKVYSKPIDDKPINAQDYLSKHK
jgi:hypothetical protein